VVIFADRFRTQERNREDALKRLVALIRRAAEAPKPRRATKPPAAASEQRLKDKSERGMLKKMRRGPPPLDE
jgi:ribosome-associated protein